MLLTIFTPTYNRANKLENVYNSLKNQISSEYEWLIVDDGSIDNTKKIVEKFINDSLLNVRYIKKDNGGKHTAHNLAVDEAKGKYFMCLDSDDFLKENTINELKNFSKLNREIINSFINYIEIDEKNKKTNSQDIIIHWNF